MFSSRSVQIAAVFSDVFGQALPNLCRLFYNETKAEMFFSVFAVALLTEGVDRNATSTARIIWQLVALLTEGVDRNSQPLLCLVCRIWVALLTEGVDRNLSGFLCVRLRPFVALLTEGVDRNMTLRLLDTSSKVALLTEGVDRNFDDVPVRFADVSPSSRRAWIEMGHCRTGCRGTCRRPPHGGRG